MLRDITVEAERRAVTGKRASRKLARMGLVPGVIYGGGEGPVPFQLDPRELEAILHSKAGTNSLFRFSVGGQGAPALAMIKEVLLDPVTGRLLHADVIRVSMDRAIQVRVPIHLAGTARGVKQQGGILDFVLREVEVSCLPGEIPDRIEVDVSELDLGKAVKVSDLKAGGQIRILTDAQKTVATVVAPAAEKAAAAEAAAEPAAEAPAEPEVIKKGKAEAEPAEEGAAAKPEKEKAAKEKPEKGREKPERGKEKGGR